MVDSHQHPEQQCHFCKSSIDLVKVFLLQDVEFTNLSMSPLSGLLARQSVDFDSF